jgi:hypothetical protein
MRECENNEMKYTLPKKSTHPQERVKIHATTLPCAMKAPNLFAIAPSTAPLQRPRKRPK